jgi:hypothetical protein
MCCVLPQKSSSSALHHDPHQEQAVRICSYSTTMIILRPANPHLDTVIVVHVFLLLLALDPSPFLHRTDDGPYSSGVIIGATVFIMLLCRTPRNSDAIETHQSSI